MVNELDPSGQTLQKRVAGGPQPWIDAEDQHNRTCVRIIARQTARRVDRNGSSPSEEIAPGGTGRRPRRQAVARSRNRLAAPAARPPDRLRYPTLCQIS